MNVLGCHRDVPLNALPQKDVGQNVPPRLALRGTISAALLVVLATAGFASEQTTAVTPGSSPVEVMRKVVQNEVRAANDDVNRILFRGVKTTPKGSYTRLYVTTSQATTGEVIAYNGQPLTSDQRQAEESRIERIINNPEELKKKCQQDRENAERTLRILRALPDAFLFENAGEEQGTETVGRAGARLSKFNFHPNPAYQPPSRVEEVLTGVQGYVLVDPVQFRLAAIDATLFKDVAFGWGILGHLNKGGRFAIRQKDVGDDLWQASSITFTFTGKLLLLKAINVATTEVFSDFQRIPSNLTFAQALEFMKHQGSMMAANWIATNLRARGSFAAK